MAAAMPRDAFLDSRQTYPSGEMLSCSAAVGQNEDTLFRIVALFGMADKPQQLIVQRYDNGGMCAPPRAFLLIESHYHAFIIHIGERQSRHIAIAQSCEAAEYKCPLHFAMLPPCSGMLQAGQSLWDSEFP